MPNILESGATWLSAQLSEHCGTPCVYRRGADVFDATLVQLRSDATTERKRILSEQGISIRTDDFVASIEDLLLGNEYILPEPGDEIEWTDTQDVIHTAVVFPLIGEHCFRFTDPRKMRARIYTVALEELAQLTIRTVDKEFDVKAVLGTIQGSEFLTDMSQTMKLLRTTAYVDRGEFEAEGITSIPVWAQIDAHGLVGWSVNLSESEWGAERVKLGLDREELEREFQARRNATV